MKSKARQVMPGFARRAGGPVTKTTVAAAGRVRTAQTPPALLRECLVESFKTQRLRHRQARRRCRKSFSIDAVHRLRVESRRLIACLNLLRAFASPPVRKKDRRAVKKQLDASDALRDTQVQLQATGGMLAAYPESKAFHRYLQDRERRLTRAAAESLRRTKLAKRLSALDRALDAMPRSPETDREDRILVDRTLRKACDRAVALQRRELTDPDCLHRSRVALKKLRYMMDSVRPALSGTDAQLVDLMAARQRRLGDLHDLDLLLDRLDRFGGKENRTAARRLRAALVRRRAALARSYRAFVRKSSRRGGSVSRLRQMLSRLKPG